MQGRNLSPNPKKVKGFKPKEPNTINLQRVNWKTKF